MLGALRALAQVTLPEPPAGLRAHPLFADRRPPPEAPDPLLLGALAPLRAPERLAGLHELYRELTSSRRETGLYYTPPWLADHVVSRTLRGDEATVIDLSCGAGAFLIAALRRRLVGTADLAGRRRLANAYILGTDTDSEAVEVARAALALVVGEGERTAGDDGVPLPALSFPGLVPGDALRGTDQGFAHAVVGNPPYVDAKTRARLAPEEGAFLRARFPDLRGAFDLFAAFVLRALEVARQGAAVGLVRPDKLLPADYAAPLRRRLLAETTLCEVVDLAEANPFPDAAVFPLFVLLVRAPAGPAHAVRLARWDASRREIPTGEVLQQSLDPAFFAVRPPPVTTRALVPFSARAVVSAGAAGFDGRALCDALVDGDPGGGIPFVVTRSIDRYALLDVPVRFMKRTFATPFLPPGRPSARPVAPSSTHPKSSSPAWASVWKRRSFKGPWRSGSRRTPPAFPPAMPWPI